MPLCRICLKEDCLISLFSPKSLIEGVPLHQVYAEIIDLPVNETDDLPDGICVECYGRVQDAYNLRKQAEASLESLRFMSIQDGPSGVAHFKIVTKEGVETIQFEGEEIPEFEEIETEDPEKTEIKHVEIIDAVEFLLENKPLLEKESANEAKGRRKFSLADRKHECQVCFKKFLRKSNLVDHLRLHANVKLFKCEYCDKSFVQSGNYKAHVRTHTHERPFVCTICSKSYNQSSALKIHVRSHTNEKNYVCNVCGKAFTNSSDLNKHRRVHDPSLKFKCDFCDKSFAQKANLRLHQSNYHADQIAVNMDNKIEVYKEI